MSADPNQIPLKDVKRKVEDTSMQDVSRSTSLQTSNTLAPDPPSRPGSAEIDEAGYEAEGGSQPVSAAPSPQVRQSFTQEQQQYLASLPSLQLLPPLQQQPLQQPQPLPFVSQQQQHSFTQEQQLQQYLELQQYLTTLSSLQLLPPLQQQPLHQPRPLSLVSQQQQPLGPFSFTSYLPSFSFFSPFAQPNGDDIHFTEHPSYAGVPFDAFTPYSTSAMDRGDDSDASCDSIDSSIGMAEHPGLSVNTKAVVDRGDAPVMSPGPENVGGGKPTFKDSDGYNQTATPTTDSEKAKIELPDWNKLAKNPEELASRLVSAQTSVEKVTLQRTEANRKPEEQKALADKRSETHSPLMQFSSGASNSALPSFVAPVLISSTASADCEKKLRRRGKKK